VTGVVLAHAGPGSTWQAMVVVAGVVLAGLTLLAAAGRLRVDRPDDLVVPLAGTAIVAGLGVMGHAVLSDFIGWGLPLAVVSLLTLLLAAFTPLDIRIPAPLPMGAIPLAAISAFVLYQPLTIELHPPVEFLPLAEDTEVAILAPEDGAEITAGAVALTVAVADGSIGPGDVPTERLPLDEPSHAGALSVARQRVDTDASNPREAVAVDPEQDCTLERPCDRVDLELELAPGTWQLRVEFLRGDGTPLAPTVVDTVTVEVE
jgi:voltage-gated potassium channel Kch